MTTQTYDIEVILYAYKSKVAIEKIKELVQRSSGKYNILVRFLDQYQLDRTKNFKKMSEEFLNLYKFVYHHIFWDYIKSPIELKEQRIKSSVANYILLIDDRVSLSDNWDSDLINFVQDKNIIVSGNGSITLNQKNDFFIETEISELKHFSLTNYISESFIFAKKNTYFDIENNGRIMPTYLKYAGFEQALSLQCFDKGIDIFSCPSRLYAKDLINRFEDFNLYIPFSKIHNYNQVIRLFADGSNNYTVVSKDSIQSFINFHQFDFKKLSPLPYEKNDVSYSTQDSIFDKMDGRRFLDGVKSIN